VSARAAVAADVGACQCRIGRVFARPGRHIPGGVATRSRGGGAHARRRRGRNRARRPYGSPARRCRQPAARQAADRRDRARSRRGPGVAAARRAGCGLAPRGKAGARRSAARVAARWHDDPSGRARHGLRHGPDRSLDRDGLRRKARRRAACGYPAQSARARGVPGRRRRDPGMTVLAVERLSVAYGKVLAVRDVSLQLAPGSIVTVIGPNGAGKTTLLGAIAGLLPAQGTVHCFGCDATSWTVEERVARGLVLVPERRELFASMSVEDNLRLGAFARRRERRAMAMLAEVYVRFPRLAERQHQLAGTLSGGERQMLALGRALMSKPRVLLLDEPSLGLAPLVVRDIFAIIAALSATGVAVLLVEQNARAALQIADYGYVLETGQIAF